MEYNKILQDVANQPWYVWLAIAAIVFALSRHVVRGYLIDIFIMIRSLVRVLGAIITSPHIVTVIGLAGVIALFAYGLTGL